MDTIKYIVAAIVLILTSVGLTITITRKKKNVKLHQDNRNSSGNPIQIGEMVKGDKEYE